MTTQTNNRIRDTKTSNKADNNNRTHRLKNTKTVTEAQLDNYFRITGQALEMCRVALDKKRLKSAKDFLDMAERYYSDAQYFRKNGNYVLAFAALNYAHGWLDAGARIELFDVHDSRLFTVDDK